MQFIKANFTLICATWLMKNYKESLEQKVSTDNFVRTISICFKLSFFFSFKFTDQNIVLFISP